MKKEQLTEHTQLWTMEPSDTHGWGGCVDMPMKLVTVFGGDQQGGFYLDRLFDRRPTAADIASHEEEAHVRWAERQKAGKIPPPAQSREEQQ